MATPKHKTGQKNFKALRHPIAKFSFEAIPKGIRKSRDRFNHLLKKYREELFRGIIFEEATVINSQNAA